MRISGGLVLRETVGTQSGNRETTQRIAIEGVGLPRIRVPLTVARADNFYRKDHSRQRVFQGDLKGEQTCLGDRFLLDLVLIQIRAFDLYQLIVASFLCGQVEADPGSTVRRRHSKYPLAATRHRAENLEINLRRP